MRSCLTVWLVQGKEARRTVVKASAANHGTIPVESFCCRRIVHLHLDLRSGHPCPKRTARATGGVGWQNRLRRGQKGAQYESDPRSGPGTGFAHAVGTARGLGDAGV